MIYIIYKFMDELDLAWNSLWIYFISNATESISYKATCPWLHQNLLTSLCKSSFHSICGVSESLANTTCVTLAFVFQNIKIILLMLLLSDINKKVEKQTA